MLLRALAASLAVAAIPAASSAQPAEAEEPEEACVVVRAGARWRNYGFDHIVQLMNVCDLEATCAVRTDVDPAPITVVVPARERVEVVTRIGSPSSRFSATVECDL